MDDHHLRYVKNLLLVYMFWLLIFLHFLFHFDYEIIDWDEVTSHLPPIDMEKVLAELAKNDSEFYQGRKMGENE